MDYMIAKWLHILSSTILFGTGIGSAYYMLRACLSLKRDPSTVRGAWSVIANVVQADLWFTTTTIIFQPLSGWYLAHKAGFSMTAPWLMWTYGMYLLAGVCWLPVVWIQWRMRDMAREAATTQRDVPATFWRMFHAWIALGVPAFFALTAVFYLMVAKPT